MPPPVGLTTLPDVARLLISAALLMYCSVALGRRLGARWSDRFWISIAAAVTQIGTIAVVLSPMYALTPLGFLFAQCVIAGVIGWTCRRPGDETTSRARLQPITATPSRRLLLLLIGLFLLLGLWLSIVLPVFSFDDRMYRASRAVYWLQHRSVLPWTTANDRQTAFPFGSELMFFWPLLFTRWELPGRLAFFAAVPLCAVGLYTVMRQLRITRTAALGGVLVLLATPSVTRIQEGLYPEMWMSVFALGAAYFAQRALSDGSRVLRHLAWMGCFVTLAVNVKTTALALAPAAVIVPWLVAPAGARRRGMASVIVGAVAGILLSGLVLTLSANIFRHGHPLGPPGMSAIHTADLSARQLRTHAARFVVGLLDLPVVPTDAARNALTRAGNAFLRFCRATQPLAGEEVPWPGSYGFGVGKYGSRYSLAGLLWLPALTVAVALVLFARGWHRLRLAILLLFALPMLLGSVLIIRWMGSMERFWVPAFALTLPALVLLVQLASARWPATRFVIVPLLLLTVLPVLWDRAQTAASWQRMAPSPMLLNEPFHSPLRAIPAGSRILLVTAQDAREYGLFLPRQRFANRVIPWGAAPFDPARMQRMLDEHAITHVLVQDDQRLSMHWGASIDTRAMVGWLTQHPALREIPVVTPGMRLFRRVESATPRP
ncbi:MAG TPA: hypothetical protein VGR35_20805 [Tepidisphaeraceae bacterium]|nr:hypothetical protein [Tepidisphaeraceae bacterium]